MKKRIGQIERKTKETEIIMEINLDGEGKSKINTGIPFLDHMLSLFAKHGLFDLEIQAKGDLEVDIHHTNEDVGICLGEALKKALGDKKGIRRFGTAFTPMDEALARVVVDLSGRPHLSSIHTPPGYSSESEKETVYTLDYARQFLGAFVNNSGTTLNIELLSGGDVHHTLEALFKSLGRALDEATQIDKRIKGVPSTKGKL
jgi:imidazoleglycerol-phosphate dehydratase